jgi:uncharacterized protein YecE (DUF72 family)
VLDPTKRWAHGADIRIGTAGWSLTPAVAARFEGTGQHLERYAHVLRCAEINSSFHRSHRFETYRKWAGMVPDDFRFSVKLPRTITHEGRLTNVEALLDQFLEEAAGLQDKFAVLLVQLPPKQALDLEVVEPFMRRLRDRFDGLVACEPRHASWFDDAANEFLIAHRVSRVAADPVLFPGADRPAGWLGEPHSLDEAVHYYRWHGSPRRYYSKYEPDWIAEQARAMKSLPEGSNVWCIFDNTASGAAIEDAVEFQGLAVGRR